MSERQYQLLGTQGSDHFHAVEVWLDGTVGRLAPERFDLGEPVNLNQQHLVGESIRPLLRENKIWWITSIEEKAGAGCVHVARTRNGSSELRASPVSLLKLNAMERLAVEYAF